MDSPAAIYLNPFQLKISNLVIEADFLSNPEILILAEDFPQQAPFVYFALVLGMAREGGYLPRNFLPSVAKLTNLPIKIVNDVLARAISLGFIHDAPAGLTCKRVQRECEKTAKMRFAKEKRPLIFPWECDPPSPVQIPIPDKSGVNGGLVGGLSPQGKERKGKESQGKESKGEERAPAAAPPPGPPLPPPKDPEPPPDEYAAGALTLLDDPDGSKPWEKTNSFINAGRRPLKKHQEMLFTPSELADVLRQFDKIGLPLDSFKDGIAIAKAELTRQKAQGIMIQTDRVVGWFMGWIPEKLMERQIKKQILAKTAQRLNA